MANDFNQVTLCGRLGKDPEVRFLPNGNAVCNLSLATKESWRDKNTGETKEKSEWHRIVVWGKLAEIAGEYCKKGQQLLVQGKLTTREWEKEGEKRYTTEIVLQGPSAVLQMLGGKPQGQGGGNGGQAQQPQQQRQAPQSRPVPANEPEPLPFSDDCPF